MTSTRISFRDIDVSQDGWIRCNVIREDTQEFRIQLPYSFVPSTDLIAAAYASVCGTQFEEVEIDLPIGPGQAAILETALQTKMIHRPGLDIRHRPGSQQGLNFSGGFDSLAAKEILNDAHLISLDFGGRFSRERHFFQRFAPMTFETNLVDLKLNTYTWQFMGIGAVLLRDELQLRTYSFGAIQAGSLPRLFSRTLDQSTAGLPAANALGMSNANPVSGITEIGALQIVMRNHPRLLTAALKSVALPGEDKYQRKYQMVEAVSANMGLPVRLPKRPVQSRNPQWGTSFATDLSSLFVIKTLGADYISSSYQDGIPDQVLEKLDGINLTFMERLNPHAYNGISHNVLARWYERMVQNGVLPYERQDWFDAANVMKLLRGEL